MPENKEVEDFSAELLRLIDEAATEMHADLKGRAPSILRDARRDRAGFEERLYKRWSNGLDLLELILILAQDAGAEFSKRHWDEVVKENDVVFDVLTKLHARACLTTSEVLALLRTGHASGAQARWRTLHELAVVAYFIKKHGNGVAEKYLLHEWVKAHEDAEKYQKYCGRLGYPPFEDSHIQQLKVNSDGLAKRFGDSFPGSYGWAADTARTLGSTRPGKRVTFEGLEAAVGIGHLHPFYRLSSHSIHADVKGITFNIGLMEQGKLLLAGPSNAGLADPANCSCISLYQVTAVLLTHRPDVESLTALKAIGKLVDEANDAFGEAHSQLEKEESLKRKNLT